MKTLVINNRNSTPTNNGTDKSRFVYNFPVGAVEFKDDEIAVSSLSIYYSWFSITTALVNNTFSYTWPVGPVTVNVTVPDGFYTIAQLNAYLQSVMIANNQYLLTASGQYVYYVEFIENPSKYAVQLNCYPVPTAAQAAALGYTAPAGWTGYPAVASTPLVTIAANSFRDIIGFNAGTYPTVTQATTFSKISDYTPQVTPVQSVLISCSLVNNPYALPNNIIFGFAPSNTTFGSIIQPNFSNLVWNEIRNGYYNFFQIQFLDQSFNPLLIQDVNLVLTLSIRKKNKFNID